ncbi:MAG TPA: translation factor GTPase family protein [Mobilitalea sp.]|nr:translation factor GTPase family protein [Mobilitalea sp.]
MKRLVIGILAHVDAGKTTLAESILYLTGVIRKLGRVDHKDAFLDTYELERARGITIFSKQAELLYHNMEVTLLDTPGHVDFSAEMERTLQVLDYAILVISGSDGIQGHTETLWRLLNIYRIPTYIFVNKMDLTGTDRIELMRELKKRLNDGCIDFSVNQDREVMMENIAMSNETLLDKYMDSGVIGTEDIVSLIAERKIFPCYFGSALKLEGVEEFLDGLEQFSVSPLYPDKFGAKIYKIARDDQGNRLTYMKVTGGRLKVKMLLTNRKEKNSTLNQQLENVNLQTAKEQSAKVRTVKEQKANEQKGNEQKGKEQDKIEQENKEMDIWEEKADQIRIYSGAKYIPADEVVAGAICAVMGLSRTYPGEGLGIESVSDMPILEPVLSYKIILPPEYDIQVMLSKLRLLEEEDPQLHIIWNEQLKEIHLQLMGEVQTEIIKSLILERFGVDVEFGSGSIVYKETIMNSVEGVGHFEPLRHYAEVHLLLEPGELGSGLVITSSCSEDVLDRNWQRLILTHIKEKDHVGVLTGSPITNMKITLITGRAHLKHTEGGDFRQATYRAIRQGLKEATCVLLEPYYSYRMEIPSETLGRAMSDIGRMYGSFAPPEIDDELSILTGYVPVVTMQGYLTEMTSYTRGRGRLLCTLKGYEPCHNSAEVIETIDYDSERDLENPTSSVFCSQGAGFLVEWDKVKDYMHMDSGWNPELAESLKTKESPTELEEPNWSTGLKESEGQEAPERPTGHEGSKGNHTSNKSQTAYSGSLQEDKELEAIFARTFGALKQRQNASQSGLGYEKKASIDIFQGKDTLNTEKKELIRDLRKVSIKEFVREPIKEYLLVDGYNIIFSWEDLNELANENMDAARVKLMDILCNYQGFKKCILILVFDAYKVKGGIGEVQDYHNIHVVYTKEAETADEYIEKVTHDIARKHLVTVATSDALEQLVILGQGAIRLSANDLKEEINRVRELIHRDYLDRPRTGRNFLGDHLSDEIKEYYIDNDGGTNNGE